MNIKELAAKYSLGKGDFWELPQKKGLWILTHDSIEKIANQEGIALKDFQVLNSEAGLCRFLITMQKGDRTVTSIGEADKSNCKANYLGCMAEKRGIDRCVLKLINAYEYGIKSEEEADDFKQQAYTVTEAQKEEFQNLKDHPCFVGKKGDLNRWFKKFQTEEQAEDGILTMREKIMESEAKVGNN